MNVYQICLLGLFFLPGFVLTFIVLRLRSRGKSSPIFGILLWSTGGGLLSFFLISASLAALFIYEMRTVETDVFDSPMSVDQARKHNCPIPLPEEARNVQFASASGGMISSETLVRFEAPVAVCRHHIQTILDAIYKENHLTPPPAQLQPILYQPALEDHDMLGRATWFDVENIRHGSFYDGPKTQLWIDEDHGIFYCKITD
jgi:hypothetical protein